jgi:hypothetical protein
MFLDFGGPPGRRDQDHAFAFEADATHLIGADPARV